MTSEADWFAALEQHPDDFELLRQFSDWLADRGDDRAPGYAAMGREGKRPWHADDGTGVYRWYWYSLIYAFPSHLPGKWYRGLGSAGEPDGARTHYPTHRAAVDDAARAYSLAYAPEVSRA